MGLQFAIPKIKEKLPGSKNWCAWIWAEWRGAWKHAAKFGSRFGVVYRKVLVICEILSNWGYSTEENAFFFTCELSTNT